MLGIDIARYQNVTDWNAVKRHGVSFVWVKGTDGGGPAPVQRADAQVAGARSVGIPVGIYHYAQLSPSPEAQADVLAAEVRRLEARYGPLAVPPALDLEDPHSPGSAAATFARRFLTRLKAHGFNRVMIYANTSMLTGIRADDIRRDIPGVGIWAARYGANDGQNNGLGGYGGWVDVHQYTAVGQVPGIRASGVDLNEAANLDWMNGAPDVNLTDPMRKYFSGPGTNWPEEIKDMDVGTTLANTFSFAKNAYDLGVSNSDRLARLEARPAADVDEADLAAELDARNIGGVSAAELIEIMGRVRLGVTPPAES